MILHYVEDTNLLTCDSAVPWMVDIGNDASRIKEYTIYGKISYMFNGKLAEELDASGNTIRPTMKVFQISKPAERVCFSEWSVYSKRARLSPYRNLIWSNWRGNFGTGLELTGLYASGGIIHKTRRANYGMCDGSVIKLKYNELNWQHWDVRNLYPDKK
jgi:prepilin-type processing-associated H-X9-DG protein